MQAILTTTVFSLAAGIIGALVGAFTVHRLTRSREFESWSRDARLKEWRELLETMTNAYMTLLTLSHSQVLASRTIEDGVVTEKHDVLAEVDITLATRIFISDDVEKLDLRMKWAALVTHFVGTLNRAIFKSEFQAVRAAIVATASHKGRNPH
jgi:hypothetical protein